MLETLQYQKFSTIVTAQLHLRIKLLIVKQIHNLIFNIDKTSKLETLLFIFMMAPLNNKTENINFCSNSYYINIVCFIKLKNIYSKPNRFFLRKHQTKPNQIDGWLLL